MTRLLMTIAVASVALAAPVSAPAAQWSATADVPGSDGVGYPYDVAMTRDGTAAIAFIRGGIRVVRRTPAGVWGRPRKVSLGRTAVAAPDVAVDGAGEVLVVWTASRVFGAPATGTCFIRVAVRGADGRWSAERTVGRTAHFVDAQPRLATNTRGDAVLVWRGLVGRGRRVHEAIQASVRRSGGTFAKPTVLDDGGTDLQVAVGDDGSAYAAWSHFSPPTFARSAVRFSQRPANGAWSHPDTVAGGNAGGPQLAVTPDRHVLLAWRGAQRGIGATRTGYPTATTRGLDGTVAPAQLLSFTRTTGPLIAVAPSGEALVVWSPPPAALDPTAGGPSLFWAARPLGGAFGPAAMLPGLRALALATLADGTAVALLAGKPMLAAVRPPGAGFGFTELVARRGHFPVLAAGGRSAVAVWLDHGRLRASTRG